MERALKHTLAICLILLVYGCSKHHNNYITLSDISIANIPEEFEHFIELKSWIAIGPFEFNPKKSSARESYFNEDLKRYGVKEGLIDDTNLEKLQRRGVSTFLIDIKSLRIRLFSYVFNRVERKSNFYLVTQINSTKNQDATLILDGTHSYAVWLNGDKIIEERGRYNTNKAGDRFVNVSLMEGTNTLYVKINRGGNVNSWDWICAVAPLQEAERIFRINYTGDFVINPFVHDSIEIYAGPYSIGKVTLLNEKDSLVAESSFEYQDTNQQAFVISGLERLDEGFYKAMLTVDGEAIEEIIYKGDFKAFIERAQECVNSIESNSQYADDLTVTMQRVNYLNEWFDDISSPNEMRFQNRNRVFWGYSLHRMLHRNALTQLMTYKDEDDHQGVFIFHTGDRQQKGRPLVIMIPYALSGESMIEDWYASNLHQIAVDIALADQYGLAIAWIYADGKNYSAMKTEKEITAVLNRLHSAYEIDLQNVFTLGSCEGGRRALVQLAASPGRYAGCAATSPITLSGGMDGVPIHLLPRMDNVPIFIMHGINDETSPVEESRRFYAEAQKHNVPIEYIENEDSHEYIHRDFFRLAFQFFNLTVSKR